MRPGGEPVLSSLEGLEGEEKIETQSIQLSTLPEGLPLGLGSHHLANVRTGRHGDFPVW